MRGWGRQSMGLQTLEDLTMAELMEMKEVVDEVYGLGMFDQTVGKALAALLTKVWTIRAFMGRMSDSDKDVINLKNQAVRNKEDEAANKKIFKEALIEG